MSRAQQLYETVWSKFDTDQLFRQRQEMVDQQLAGRDITDERVLDVMRYLPRHVFVLPAYQNRAYDDSPVEIGNGQTISQPYMVAWMTQLLDIRDEHRVLDVGTGSGYQAAILAVLAKEVHTIELHHALLESAEARFSELGLANIHTHCGDGSEGSPDDTPFDRIIVAAAAPGIPESLRQQLSSEGGRMVLPVGSRAIQDLTVVLRNGDHFSQSGHGGCIFVPLLGRQGWS